MQPLALYIHWPFCRAKCPYCDFNSHVREHIPENRIIKALRTELAFEAERLGKRRLASIFFGGGTPSLMAPDSVAALIDDATTLFAPEPDLEITLEANPTSIEAERFKGYRGAGVNRVSIGVQSLDDAALRFLGRQHSAAEAIAAAELGRSIFPRASFDLIYAQPGQSLSNWRDELGRVLALGFDHLSLYQLTIEPGTQFATRFARGDFVLPENDDAAALYDATAEAATRFGLEQYEISNYARPGQQSRHNLAYWRYQDYAGIGPGAHGRITIDDTLLATRRHRAPEEWASRVEANSHGSVEEVKITPDERAREALLMGLRLAEGIDAAAYRARTGIPLHDMLDPGIVDQATLAGYLEVTPDRLIATAEGRKRLDSLLAALIR
ncbi:radical SAM family heme chaperone HemW [Acidiphilium sp. AL]|uniref:Heme chaperone HemW n=1 Tax=Acidiphilium iwatense TaxID=768198 RepID=A0ABS9DVK4_9PROT|nr:MULTISPECIES: radical SAM family heme chaperone HemW [Acidiphilium]MCF3946190.1 radical SAM family heme chaperone HemW [Acidiphilium iwatense]MCU4158762.1 radical SAM family heme chaperone HemW [Acidiphilium sp. AL]